MNVGFRVRWAPPSAAFGMLAVVAHAAVACGSGAAPGASGHGGDSDLARRDAGRPATTGVVSAAVLPTRAGQFAPSRLIAPPGKATVGAHLSDAETCADCHEEVASQWAGSAHAFASFSNPIYRSAIERLRVDRGAPMGRFCAGCHDIALLVDGAMDSQVQPEDPRAHAGITCRVCHGVSAVTGDGNGSYTLRPGPIPLPKHGDPASVARHKRAVSREAVGADLCAACHRSFLDSTTGNPYFLPGQGEVTAWKSSAFAGNGLARVDDPVEQRDCIGCHMKKGPATHDDPATDEDGQIASHRFLGGHTWLAAMRGDRGLLEQNQAFLRQTVSVDIAAARDAAGNWTFGADGVALVPGDTLSLLVVIRNLHVGHRFPGGVLDAQDTWLEVEVRDSRNRLVAEAGGEHRATGAGAHQLSAMVVDGDGTPLRQRQTHLFRAKAVDHTIAPRDSTVVSYELRIAKGDDRLRATARLMHRSRNLSLQESACRSASTARGSAFARAAESQRGARLDPCAPQPVTLIAQDSAVLGAGAEAVSEPRAMWLRLYKLGAALGHSVQEELDSARPPLRRALTLLSAEPAGAESRRHRAAVLAALAAVAGRQGRMAEAQQLLDRAAVLAPGHPALARIRAAALMRVWRWKDAIAPLRYATGKAPGNIDAWSALAMALGSLGRDREALEAAQVGLGLNPRSAALLRVQALSLRGLGAPSAPAALDAYDEHRSPDAAQRLRIACAVASMDCARERDPVHSHLLRRP